MLYDKLFEYTGVYPMHMPGHKRNPEFMPPGFPVGLDITEIHGFDNLHNPRGVLLETANIAARLFGSDRAYALVNGSTAGILAAIGACCKRGDKILMARNCHMSVYNAAALFGLVPCYIAPGTDNDIACGIDPAAVESALGENPDVKLAVVTSPTYEGVISDIGAIAETVHKRGIPLLADEAHGAHLEFLPDLRDCTAIHAGADVAVMSLHKTLPALTQCALLHVCGRRVDTGEISRLLSVFQTSSPSYILMASIDHCLRLLESDSRRLFDEYMRNLEHFYAQTDSLRNLYVLRPTGRRDPGKIVIGTKKSALDGAALKDILRDRHKIELEMAAADYALAMTSVCDTVEGFALLAKALLDIDRGIEPRQTPEQETAQIRLPAAADTPGGALNRRGRFVSLNQAVGLMSLEYVWAYPPGIPIIVPGEIIDTDTVSYILHAGGALHSTRGRLPQAIYACEVD